MKGADNHDDDVDDGDLALALFDVVQDDDDDAECIFLLYKKNTFSLQHAEKLLSELKVHKLQATWPKDTCFHIPIPQLPARASKDI